MVVNSNIVNINLSKNRIDFFSTKESFASEHFEKIFNIITNLSVEIGRVGVVLTYFKEADTEEMKKFLINKNIITESKRYYFSI